MLKLDMMKAYDRVSWLFLIQVLCRYGFTEVWIDMIWRLISNVWCTVFVNGSPQDFFKSSRGLRQGDPISTALFVIGAEVLSRSLNTLAEYKRFRPFKVPRGCSMVTHLAYADDVVIFTSGLKASITLVKGVVDEYCAFSGQRVNCQKSCYLVHPTLSLQRRAMIGMVTGFSYKSFPIKYLGCPLYIGRRRMHYFAELCDMVTIRILSLKNWVLLFGGKIVLLKSVLFSMPIHLLAAASPPKGVIASLERVIANFL